MGFPTILVHSSGSDTAASGAGPATALSGTAAAVASNTTVTLSVDAPDLSGVATDGSAVVWVETSSGRRWSRITAVNNIAKTVTVADAYSVTESGKNWGIGGKRATLDASIRFGLDVRGGWAIDVQSNQVLTQNFVLSPNAVSGSPFTLFSSVGNALDGTGVMISTSTNAIFGVSTNNANNVQIRNLHFKSTAGTPGDGIGPAATSGSASDVVISGCVIEGFRNGVTGEDNGNNVQTVGLVVSGNEIKSCTNRAVWVRQKGATVVGNNCHGNGTASAQYAIELSNGQGPAAHVVVGNVVYANAGGGIKVTAAQNTYTTIVNNSVGNSTGTAAHGIFLNSSTQASFLVRGNVAYGNNGTSAKDVQADASLINAGFFDYNSYGTLGGSWVAGPNDETLTASPWVSSTDFALNDDEDGGQLCKANGLNPPNATATATAPDRGAVPTGGGVDQGSGTGGLIQSSIGIGI